MAYIHQYRKILKRERRSDIIIIIIIIIKISERRDIQKDAGRTGSGNTSKTEPSKITKENSNNKLLENARRQTNNKRKKRILE